MVESPLKLYTADLTEELKYSDYKRWRNATNKTNCTKNTCGEPVSQYYMQKQQQKKKNMRKGYPLYELEMIDHTYEESFF